MAGSLGARGACAAAGCEGACECERGCDRPCRIHCSNASPSMSRMFRPLAKSMASCVKRPEVTTKPPAAPRAAITP